MAKGFILLAIAVIFNGVANVLMKKGMSGTESQEGIGDAIRHYLTSWPIIVGLTLFALNVIAYTQSLSRIPLSVAYPIMCYSRNRSVIISGLDSPSSSVASSWWQND